MKNVNATKAKNQAVKAKIDLLLRINRVSHLVDDYRLEETVARRCRKMHESNLRKLLAEARGLK